MMKSTLLMPRLESLDFATEANSGLYSRPVTVPEGPTAWDQMAAEKPR
jgi:hypothetical protein